MRRHGPVIAHCTDLEDFPAQRIRGSYDNAYQSTFCLLTYMTVHASHAFSTSCVLYTDSVIMPRADAWFIIRLSYMIMTAFTLSYHSEPPVNALENICITVSSEFGFSDFLFADDIIIFNLKYTSNRNTHQN